MVFIESKSGEGGTLAPPGTSGIEQKLLLDRQVTELPEVCLSSSLLELPERGSS